MTYAIPAIGLPTDVSVPSFDPAQSSASLDFSELLKSGASKLVADSSQANSLLSQFAAGADIAPHTLVMAMEQAKMSLQLAVEVRNRAVDAYQELTRLQI